MAQVDATRAVRHLSTDHCPLVTLPSLSHLCCSAPGMRPLQALHGCIEQWARRPHPAPHHHPHPHCTHPTDDSHCDRCGAMRHCGPDSDEASARTELACRLSRPRRPLAHSHSYTAKVMLTALVLCVTISSCQTLHSVIESPPSKSHLEWRSTASGKEASPFATGRVQQITYINQRAASVPLVRYEHANRPKKRRPTRTDKRLHRPQSPEQPSARPPPFVPSLSMLSGSLLTVPMKPPYVSGSPSLPSPLASASRTETPSSPRNITAQVGHPAYLHCIVESLGDKMVSWIRLRDFHLLTIGSLTYIQEDRFAVRHAAHSPNDWSLQIKHVTVKDEGLYECQINSDPPRSQYYYLHIVVPVSEITGNPDIFVRSGAPINLTCLISSSPEPPAFVFWYHNNRMINYDYSGDNKDSAGQISVQKDPIKNDVVVSHLLIRKARLEDSGNYTCSPSNAEPASSYVHVLQGEKRMSNQIQNDWSPTDQLSNEAQRSSLQLATWTLNVQLAALIFASTVCLWAR